MRLRYRTADVFTSTVFGGNPVAVVFGAQEIEPSTMQAIARDFNYSETTFILPPSDRGNTACVRIFTPRTEVPFAGHPTLGTAFLLAKEYPSVFRKVTSLRLEERAGIVHVDLLRSDDRVVGAELLAPEALGVGPKLQSSCVSNCLSLASTDLCDEVHPPTVISVGLPILVVELRSADALARSRVNLDAFGTFLPVGGADSIFAYTRDVGARGDVAYDLDARMFSPLDGIGEDPATGSAVAALAALLAKLGTLATQPLRVRQGAAMGRPSFIEVRSANSGEFGRQIYVSGTCVAVMSGTIEWNTQRETLW